MVKKILCVDDEPGILTLLKDYFEMNGYQVLTAKCGEEAVAQASKGPDLILLDINMPDMDGMEVCAKIRDHVGCPILFLTARVEEMDKINGFAMGGDDYIVKPFSLDVLGARVAAHLRREERTSHRTEARFMDDLVIDYGQRLVCYKHQPVLLARKEFDIVKLLSMNAGQVFDKERIYERVWGYEGTGDSAVVAEHIRRIRQKLAAFTDRIYLETVWGVGYKWVR
jgi:DNA-binding response OmpR family regulator